MSSNVGRDPHARPPKMVLICPTCGHESPLGGDWRIDTRHDSTDDLAESVYVCPECTSDVTRRPAESLVE
ncbi:hypothetical protein [Halogranum rubrum]|uniref:hypothetical protein n=1 Tax=Halogranum rubrum TaxID=553466 RepID=UPI000677BEB8|nr:hypothetical protein [Halogranum salarium]